jgi:hypothetical protein
MTAVVEWGRRRRERMPGADVVDPYQRAVRTNVFDPHARVVSHPAADGRSGEHDGQAGFDRAHPEPLSEITRTSRTRRQAATVTFIAESVTFSGKRRRSNSAIWRYGVSTWDPRFRDPIVLAKDPTDMRLWHSEAW